MAALAGRLCTIKVGGTSTAMTDEACSGSGTAYQITSTSKRCVDPGVAVTVKVNNVALADADFTMNHATGQIVLASSTTQAVTVTGNYIPLVTVAEARSASITLPTNVMADVTRVGDASRRMLAVAQKCEVTLEHFISPASDIDDSGSTLLFTTLVDGDPIFVEVAVSTSLTLRGWFVPSSASWAHKINEALVGTLALTGVVRTCVGTSDQALFSLTTA